MSHYSLSHRAPSFENVAGRDTNIFCAHAVHGELHANVHADETKILREELLTQFDSACEKTSEKNEKLKENNARVYRVNEDTMHLKRGKKGQGGPRLSACENLNIDLEHPGQELQDSNTK